jgi:Copper type II ascorbate-dependent monooxygenase, C-terminal domain
MYIDAAPPNHRGMGPIGRETEDLVSRAPQDAKRPVLRLFSVAAGLMAVVVLASCASSTTSPGAGGVPAVTSAGTRAASHSPAPLRPGEHFTTVTMPQPYTPQAPSGGTDEYRCFLVDPKLTTTQYLTGSQFLPQNSTIVHHAIFFRVSPADADKARAADAADPGEGWTCFGDAGIGAPAAWVAHWAPGVSETLLDPGLGYPMPPGSMLVMQVHYNLLATGGRPGGSDQSGIRLRLADGSKNLTPLQTSLLEAPVELPCASDESGPLCDRTAAVADVTKRFGADVGSVESHLIQACAGGTITPGPTQHCDQPARRAGTIYAVAGHMHLLGRSITIELNPGTPTAQTLLDVQNYDFDNQAIVPLAKPVTMTSSDVLRVTCTHDASLRKQIPALKGVPARYVVWGDGTSDEMCLGLLVWSPQA